MQKYDIHSKQNWKGNTILQKYAFIMKELKHVGFISLEYCIAVSKLDWVSHRMRCSNIARYKRFLLMGFRVAIRQQPWCDQSIVYSTAK